MKIVVLHQTTFDKNLYFHIIATREFLVKKKKITKIPIADKSDLYAMHVINLYYKWIGIERSDLDMVIVYLKT